ncbi:MAG: enoyl-CoA hydratase/isomerase family protein [Ectothiorhodospiraceae bacterium]|nr:enoyl-CoA hydratase/isomerase family protein [Ectothiorhodospiraceae bacterium]
MRTDDFTCLHAETRERVLVVSIDYAPINLMDAALIKELDTVARRVARSADIHVVILRSSLPNFFIAHADVGMIADQKPREGVHTPWTNGFQQMTERFRRLPQITIGQIEGHAGGGGCELLLALDMRFAAIGKARLSQPEVGLGIIPGGGGTQRLARLAGRSRALEIILGCEGFDAETAERYGYVNRALPADTIAGFVDRLATRIAGFPKEAVQRAKASVLAAERDWESGLALENGHFEQCLRTPGTQERLRRFLDIGGQTETGERRLDALLTRL